MPPDSSRAGEPAPAPMSELSRVTGVFFEPGKTFEQIAARPRWIVPLALVIAASVAYAALIGQRIGWEPTVRQQLENSPRGVQMSPEQRERAVGLGTQIASVTAYAGPVVGIPIYYLIIAGVLAGIVAGILSAPVTFRQVFAVVCYAGLPGVLFSILSMAVMLLKRPEEFNIRNPLVSNPAAFLDPQTGSRFVYSLAGALDIFSIWTILLLAAGLKAAAGRRLSFGAALGAVVVPWAAFVLARAALAGTGLLG